MRASVSSRVLPNKRLLNLRYLWLRVDLYCFPFTSKNGRLPLTRTYTIYIKTTLLNDNVYIYTPNRGVLYTYIQGDIGRFISRRIS